jgi:FtsH-binding integral membrane protein
LAYGYLSRKEQREHTSYLIIALSGIILAAIGILRGPGAMPVGTVAANLVVIVLGGYLFWKGLNELDRSYFWIGMGLLIAEVTGRFFEYQTGLLWKSAAFIFAGLALIYGGILFEKKRGRVNHDAA